MAMIQGKGAREQRSRGERFSSIPPRPSASGPLASRARIQEEHGQAVVLFALILPVMSIFAVLIMEYMVTTARMMSAVAAADLAAHAGAQEIRVDPDGTIQSTGAARQVAAAYFQAQQMENVVLANISCGRIEDRPACQVAVQVRTAGYILPAKWVPVNATGYLSHGVTRGDQ